MIKYQINYDLKHIDAALNDKVVPLMTQAVRAVAMATQANWQESVMRAKLWSGEKDAYAKSIQAKMTSDLTAYVWTEYKNAADIETGRPPRDLKKMLDTSLKVRESKKGYRYLVIPFRHNVKTMPVEVHQQAKQLSASSIVGKTRRLSGTGAWDIKTRQPATVNQNIYKWGQRLDGNNIPRNMRGMYRFDTSTPNQNRSSYLTFRVMSEKSTGWIIPAQPGQFIAKKVAEDMQPKAELVFAEAVKRSLS